MNSINETRDALQLIIKDGARRGTPVDYTLDSQDVVLVDRAMLLDLLRMCPKQTAEECGAEIRMVANLKISNDEVFTRVKRIIQQGMILEMVEKDAALMGLER